MDILILGGTVFVGRGVAEAALARGHRVTLFHRGSKGTGLVPGADEILGDRDGGLDVLAGRKWDAVVDACGYVPRLVGDACRALAPVERYLFVSTISVYETDAKGELRVRPVLEPVGTETIDGDTYGPLKVECEREVRAVFGDRATILRPGLVYGPHDPTGRFPYWVDRFLSGGRIVVPDLPDLPLQQIDARDLGTFTVRLLEKGATGFYDAVGEDSTFGAMIAVLQALDRDARPFAVARERLEAASARFGRDLPLVMPDAGPLMRIRPESALAAGLQRRPLTETVRDTADWLRSPEASDRTLAGMTRERESEILGKLSP